MSQVRSVWLEDVSTPGFRDGCPCTDSANTSRNRGLKLVLAVLALVSLGSVALAQDGPDRRIRELQVLDQFAGTWTGTQPGTKRKVQVESEWILRGRVLQTTLKLTDGREMLILRTYDPSLRKYVATIWDSQGMAVILSGDWNPQEKTLSVAADAGRLEVRADWQLEDENTEQWQVVFANAGGRQQRKTAGTNRRDQP